MTNRWSYVFMDFGNGLTVFERAEIAACALTVYRKGMESASIRAGTYEGRVTIEKEYMQFHGFSGKIARVEIDVNPIKGRKRGRTNLSLLMTERINPEVN